MEKRYTSQPEKKKGKKIRGVACQLAKSKYIIPNCLRLISQTDPQKEKEKENN